MVRKIEIFRAIIIGFYIMLLATPAFARSIELKGVGTALWIFLIVGAIIILLQLIPAAILFSSFIGTTASMFLKKEKGVILHGSKPMAIKE